MFRAAAATAVEGFLALGEDAVRDLLDVEA
jgi:hypothetical protein